MQKITTSTPDTEKRKLPAYSLLTEKDVAVLLKISISKLQKDRVHGCGIPFCTLGKARRYRLSDVLAFIEANMHSSTSQVLGTHAAAPQASCRPGEEGSAAISASEIFTTPSNKRK